MSITTPKTRKMLEAQPWIDIRKLKIDTRILIEAAPFIYELRILDNEGMVEISSSDPRLVKPMACLYTSGIYDLDDTIMFPFRLAASLKMRLRFLNGILITEPMQTARLIGKDYYYDVF